MTARKQHTGYSTKLDLVAKCSYMKCREVSMYFYEQTTLF